MSLRKSSYSPLLLHEKHTESQDYSHSGLELPDNFVLLDCSSYDFSHVFIFSCSTKTATAGNCGRSCTEIGHTKVKKNLNILHFPPTKYIHLELEIKLLFIECKKTHSSRYLWRKLSAAYLT